MFWPGTHLQLVLVVVGDDGDAEVAVLPEQWSSLQLGAHLDLLSSLSLALLRHSPQSDLRSGVLILKWWVVGQLYLSPSISLAIMDTASTLRLDLSLMSDVTLSLYLYHLVQLKRDSYRQS